MKLSDRSEKNLVGVHSTLEAVVRLAAQTADFVVTEGVRTKERQAVLYKQGASWTMNSRHLTGHAVDLAALIDFDGDGDMEIRWDWPLYTKLNEAMQKAAADLGVTLTWGGNWQKRDGPHWEINPAQYP